jgi:hypothetical protein
MGSILTDFANFKFKFFPALKTLDISRNQVDLKDFVFDQIKEIKSVNLSSMSLKTLDFLSHPLFEVVDSLILSANLLEEIKQVHFDDKANLIELY